MERQIVPYVDETSWLSAREPDVSSTLVAAMCGLDPSISLFALWHNKHRGVELPFKENERTRAGRKLQEAIAEMASEDLGTGLEPMTEYVRFPSLRLGASFDYRAPGADLIVECKNVDAMVFRSEWNEEEGFGVQAPPRIEAQVQAQMLVSGIHRAFIAALVGGNRMVLLERHFDPAVGDGIMAKAEAFWSQTTEPDPDFPRDALFVARLYGYSEDGKVIEADEEVASLFREYAGYRSIAKSASDNMDSAKAKILMRIGNAEKVLHPEFSLSAKEVKPTRVEAYDRKGFRGFKLYEKKV